MVPFRNPLDSIPSWQKFPSGGCLEEDVKFYIRFYSAVLTNLHKIVLMDFESFTKDIEYIKNKVSKTFNLDSKQNITDFKIKEKMLMNGKNKNLPQNNQEELNIIKEQLTEEPLFIECVKLFNKLKDN